MHGVVQLKLELQADVLDPIHVNCHLIWPTAGAERSSGSVLSATWKTRTLYDMRGNLGRGVVHVYMSATYARSESAPPVVMVVIQLCVSVPHPSMCPCVCLAFAGSRCGVFGRLLRVLLDPFAEKTKLKFSLYDNPVDAAPKSEKVNLRAFLDPFPSH